MPKSTQKTTPLSIAKTFLLLLMLAYTIFVMLLPNKYDCNALVISAFPCAISALMLFRESKTALAQKSERAFFAVYTVLYIIMLSVFDIFKSTVTALSDDFTVQILIGMFIVVSTFFGGYLCFCKAYLYFIKDKELPALQNSTEKSKPYSFCLLLIAIFTFIFFLISKYGYGYPDSNTLAYYATRPEWHDWHTIAYELFYWICFKILTDSFYFVPINFAQAVFWIIICNYALKSLYDEFSSMKVIKVYTFIAIIIFPPFLYTSISVKDTMFSMFMLSYAISIFNFIRKERPDKKEYILLAINAALATLFRHIAFEIVLISLAVILIYKYFKYKFNPKDIKKFIAVAITPIIVFVGITVGIGDGILHKVKNPEYIKYTLPIYLSIACAYKLGDDFGAENREVFDRITPLENWIEYYNEDIYWADTVSRKWAGIGENVYSFDDEFYKGVIKVNANLVLNHPKEYITSASEISSIIWNLGKPNDCKEYYPSSASLDDHRINDPSIGSDFLGKIIDFTIDNPLLLCVYWRGGFWILAAIFASFVLIKKNLKELLLIILPTVLYTATLFISIPSQEPRFILSFIEVGIFYLVIAFFKKAKPENEAEIKTE